MINTSEFTKNDAYLMLALDHRQSFRKLVNPKNPDNASQEEVVKIKKEIIDTLYEHYSGLLIDFEYGLPAYFSYLGNETKPFLLPAEDSGYLGEENNRINSIQKYAAEIKENGASGVKLLIYFNPHAKAAKQQMETAQWVLANAHEQDLPLFLEIVTYGKTSVEESVQTFLDASVFADVFKIEYPGSEKDCVAVTKMLKDVPWILLTRGEDFATFEHDIEIAQKNGCRGFLAGRALWQEGVSIRKDKERKAWFSTTLIERFTRVSSHFS